MTIFTPYFRLGSGPGKVSLLLYNKTLLVPAVQQLLKYTPSNMEYYFSYAVGIRCLPLEKLRFLDEAHFNPSHLLKGKIFAQFSQRTRPSRVGSKRKACSCRLKSFPKCLIFSYRINGSQCGQTSHSGSTGRKQYTGKPNQKLILTLIQFDFVRFVLYLLEEACLVPGDILIMDSARIHGADATWDLVYGLLQSRNVRLVWLPKYSPEFNPVELYWRFLKGQIRYLPTSMDYVNLKDLVVDITASISMDLILGWTVEAITKWQQS
jgi:transposase